MNKIKTHLKLIFLGMMLSVAFIGISSITETLGSEKCPQMPGPCYGKTRILNYPPWQCCVYSNPDPQINCSDYTTC